MRAHVRLNCAVEGIEWEDGGWTIETSDGPLRARVVVAGMGPLAEPKIPDIPGLDEFEGETFHSARWNHDYDLSGKRVAAIGTGASAIQFVPEIQKQVAQLHVFQRTAPWVMPHPNRPIRALGAAPVRPRAGAAEARARRHLRGARGARARLRQEPAADEGRPSGSRASTCASQISDPELREKVTPDYTIGCKRILPSNRWYRALAKPNVELVTGGVAEVARNSVVTGDGEEREVDAIIFGTGFQVTDMPVGRMVRGPGGKTLDDLWQGSPSAHLGTAMPGFPNLFVLLGPNTGLGHTSMVYMIESQVAYVLDALQLHGRARRRHRRGARRGGRALQRRPRRAHAGHGVEHRLRELVPRRHRAQRDAVAGLDVGASAAGPRSSTPPTSSSSRARRDPEPVAA